MTNRVNDVEDVFFYDQQIKRYILQFMAIFSNLNVQFGAKDNREPGLVPVHLTYGPKDRVVAHIRGDNTQNKPLRLPAMAANLANIDLSPDRYKGKPTNRRQSYLESGGLLPDDIKVIDQRMPVPYNLNMELSVYTSNMDEHFQIMEQILVLFDPTLQVQTSEEGFDWTKIHTVELTGINNEMNYPVGPDRRIIQTTLTFITKVWFSVPAKIRTDFIKTIQMRVGAVNDLTKSSQEIINQLDGDGVDYTTLFDYDRDVDLE